MMMMLNNHKIKSFLGEKWQWYLEWFYETSTTMIIAIFLLFLIPIIIWIDLEQIKNFKDFIQVVLDRGEVIAILSATLLFFKEARNRKKSEHYEAWLVINSAQKQGGSGGRITALEDLNKDRVSLENLTVTEADLTEINLEKAELLRANFTKSRLERANLQEATLVGANLQGAILLAANLQGAILSNANLQGADLRMANLKDAVLVGVNLQEATLTGASLEQAILTNAQLQGAILNKVNFMKASLDDANLQGAILNNSNLEGADLENADLTQATLHTVNFSQANLDGTNFNYADLERANLANAIDLAEAQIVKGRICHTLLPAHIKIDCDRDCLLKPEQVFKENEQLSVEEEKQLLRLRKFIELASEDGKISQDEMQTIQSLIASDHQINIQEVKMLQELIDSKIEKGELDVE